MATKTKFSSPEDARMYNPLLLSKGLNKYSAVDKLPETIEIEKLYEEALKQTDSINLALGLTVEFGDEDVGLGGFASTGYVPNWMHEHCGRGIKKDWEEDFEFYWPKDFHGNGYMAFLGAINLGRYPYIFHELTKQKFEEIYALSSFYGGKELRENYGKQETQDTWMYLYTSNQNDCETMLPDCHVKLEQKDNLERMSEYERNFLTDYYKDKRTYSLEEERTLISDWMRYKTPHLDTMFEGGPKKYIKSIKPRFYYDGLEDRDWDAPDTGIFESRGDANVYGRPYSQQSERRYYSPSRYLPHAMTPIFHYDDENQDMCHQFYSEAVYMDSIGHKRAYHKLDSSCT